ncbi:hypothetical protein D9M71_478840 [compost metagenome]
MIHGAVDQHACAVVSLKRFSAQGVLLQRLVDLFGVEVVQHQFTLVGQLEAADDEIPAELRRHLRRQVPTVAMARHGKGVGFTLLGFGLEVADGLVAIVGDAGQLQIDGLAPGAGAGPLAEQPFGRGLARGQRFLEGHQTATEQQERQGDHNDTPGFHSILP